MSDNYNINATQGQSLEAGGMDPNNPGLTLWDAMNKNSLAQQEQAQLVQQAVEKTKQAQLQTSEQTEDEADGARQATKGLISKDQAITTLKAGLANSSIHDDQKAAVLKDAQDTWPDVVSSDGVHRMITALHEGRITKLGEGNPLVATKDMTDDDGKMIAKGSEYQDIVDTSGGHHFVQSNEPASVQNHGGAGDAVIQKRKTDFVKFLAMQLRAARGNWLSQGLYRCSTELQRLDATPMLTKQDLSQIAQGSAAIFTGGVPSEDEILKTEYSTKLGDILGKVQSWTGQVFGLPLQEIRAKLKDVIGQLYQELVHRFTTYMDFIAQGYLDVIQADPSWWADTREKALQAAEHGQNASVAVSGNLMPGRNVISTTGAPVAAPTQSTGNPQGANNDPLGIR